MDEDADAMEEGGDTVAGALRVRYDESVDIHVLPGTARCKHTGKSPLDMDSCPILNFDACGCECWPGDCEWYTEEEDDLISRTAAIDAVYYKPINKIATEVLKEVPAVDAAPVVHGRWIYKERHRKSYRQYTGYDAAGETHTIMVLEESEGKEPYCSECGAQAAESFMDFCPHCGAKMDEEATEHGKQDENRLV